MYLGPIAFLVKRDSLSLALIIVSMPVWGKGKWEINAFGQNISRGKGELRSMKKHTN